MTFDELVEDDVRHFAKKPVGALTKEDFEQVARFYAPREVNFSASALPPLSYI